MKCKHMNFRPKNGFVRKYVGSLDNCPYMAAIKGIHISKTSEQCQYSAICKHYTEVIE